MTISCPHCQFARDIDEARVPDRPIRVTCPRCKESFPFNKGEFVFEIAEIPAAPSQSGPPAEAAPAPAADLAKAGFWIRVVAAVIDSFAAGAIQMTFAALLGVVIGLMNGGDAEAQSGLAIVAGFFSVLIGVAYYVFFTGYCGQTPGKMALRIKVIRTDGSDMDYGRALLRETLGKFVSGIILGIGYLMVAFDPQKQGLHDKIADTYVIKL
jgi:predicted Zn finger-like uncharacterized protein